MLKYVVIVALDCNLSLQELMIPYSILKFLTLGEKGISSQF